MLNSKLAALDPDSKDAIDLFVDSGFFFVQAMKWPMKSYNKLKPILSRLAVEHAFIAHLDEEIHMINPQAIIALGNGAWHACSLLAQKYKSTALRCLGVEKLRGQHYVLNMKDHQIPLHVTFLPGMLNEKFSPNRILFLQSDIPRFIDCLEKGASCAMA